MLNGREIYLVRKDSLPTGPFLSYWYSTSDRPSDEFDVRQLPSYDRTKDDIRSAQNSDGCPLMVGRHYHFLIIADAIATGQDLQAPTEAERERQRRIWDARPIDFDDADIPF